MDDLVSDKGLGDHQLELLFRLLDEEVCLELVFLDLVLVKGFLVDQMDYLLEFLVVLDLLLGLDVTQVDHFLDFLYDQGLKLLLWNVL